MAEFEIRLHELEEGDKEYEFPISRAFLNALLRETDLHDGNEQTGTQDEGGKVCLRAQKAGGELILQGAVQTTLNVPCARCLETASLPLEENFTAILAPRGDLAQWEDAEELELSAEDLDRGVYDGDTVALDELVRDHILLAIPMTPLCREDCPGIVNKDHKLTGERAKNEVDPRLAPLLGWKKP